MEELPWDEWIKAALGKMRMSSSDFWEMSFEEFKFALEGFSEFNSGGSPPPLDKEELEDLMERFPD
ncbi:MAG TPA: hypothetical protein DCE52_14505 [Rhodobacteraceae bacterium]|nr:hypothetical protein [Paracoccaceae bacterium]